MIFSLLNQIILIVSLLIYLFIPLILIHTIKTMNQPYFPVIWLGLISTITLIFILSHVINYDLYVQSGFTIPLTISLFGDFIMFITFFLCYNSLASFNAEYTQMRFLNRLGISLFLTILIFVGSMITDLISNGPLFGVILEFRSPFLLRFIGFFAYFLGYGLFGLLLIKEYSQITSHISENYKQNVILFKYVLFSFWFWLVSLNIPNVFINLTGSDFLKIIIPSIITILGLFWLIYTRERENHGVFSSEDESPTLLILDP